MHAVRNKTSPARLAAALALLLAVVVSTPALGMERVDLVILHTNDMHARIEPKTDDEILGMPYIAAIVRHYRSLYPNVLVVDAGDTFHGRPISDRLYGESTAKAMNLAGYDFMVPGNHDFNFGYERLLELRDMLDFTMLGANVYKDGERLFQDYAVVEVAGKTVGIFGLATPDTYTTTHPDNIRGVEFRDMAETAAYYVDFLRNELGVDMVIALGHVGFGRNYSSTDIAAAVPGIDLFIDGHSHTLLPEGEVHHGTLFVQAYEHAHYVGKVLVDLSGDVPVMEASLIPASEGFALEPVAEIEQLLEESRAEVMRRLLGR